MEVAESLRCVRPESVITGWDFSTGAVKCLAFDLDGQTLAEVRLPTDLWTKDGVSELNLMQLEGQARASVRAMAARLKERGRLQDWVAGGISATHHSAGRVDADRVQVRRAICWNDHSLAPYHARGLERLGGQERVKELTGGPWAIRYTLSHLVKDETHLAAADWKRTTRMLPHGALAAGFLTGNFDVASMSAAASTGIMDLRTGQWCRAMLDAIENPEYRELAWHQLPRIIDQHEPVGHLSASLAIEAEIDARHRPIIFPTSDDQQAGLVGGGAVDAGQMAVILGNSAVVNSSTSLLPASGTLDAMRLNWGPYLWMRCYNNGAQFLDHLLGAKPDWERLEREARACAAGCDGAAVMPFVAPEPSLGVSGPRMQWYPAQPKEPGKVFRAALEALAHLIALGVREHEAAGQAITRITVSGGIARSPLMCEILATVLDRPLERLQSDEGPALGAAVTALASLESNLRKQQGIDAPFGVADAVGRMVKYREPATPNPAWRDVYGAGLETFSKRLAAKPAAARAAKPGKPAPRRPAAKARPVARAKPAAKPKKKRMAVAVKKKRRGK
jgi:sugar (pentulose or hexulose) kinase